MTATPLDEEISRDRWGRPWLPDPISGELQPYTRASTMSAAIDDDYNLQAWKQRQVALGLAKRPDLVASIQALDPSQKAKIDLTVKDAMEAAGSSTAANIGTAIHSFTQMVDEGKRLPEGVEPRLKASVAAYLEQRSRHGVVVDAIERFVACRAVMAAGTFDRIFWLANGDKVIADIKTGYNAPDYGHAAAVQMAIYAHGTVYTPGDGWGPSLESLGVNLDYGLLVHLPSVGEPFCQFYRCNLVQGWKMARISYRVRQWWKEKPCMRLAN